MNTITHTTKVPEMGKERKYRYNNSELVIRFGDLIEAHTDVIVCSDDNLLSAKGGASKAIREACGDVIIHDVNKKKNAELGDVVITTAGNLHHKYLFHCITLRKTEEGKVIKEEDDNLVEYVIQHSISKCLRLLTALDLSSMALPCIGAGFAGYNFERVGRIMSEVMSDFLLKTNKSYHIEIYLYGKRDDFDMMDYIAFFEQFAIRVPIESGSPRVQAPKLLKDETEKEVKTAKTAKEDVFISYSRKDQEKVNIICQYLENYGIGCWIDRESIHHGNNFKVEIIEAIRSSKVLLFVSSVNSNKSPNTVKEVSIAEKYGKVVIPIRIDDSAYDKSLEYDLCNRDWMNFQEDVDYDTSAKKLYENLRFYLDKETKSK